MTIKRPSLGLILVLVPVVLTLLLGFWVFSEIKIGSNDDDTGEDKLEGSPEADIIKGCAGGDEIYGYAGRDRLFGDGRPAACREGDATEDESDSIFGGDGNDYINGNDGGDYIDGEDGRDRISGDAGDDEIHGGLENDRLNGGDGDDSLYGEEGNDVLNGGEGDDLLDGGDGNDTLDGGPGTDHLIGGGGDDVFYLRRGQAGNGTEIVECTQNEGETGRVLLMRTKAGGFPRGTPSGTFTNTTVEIPDPEDPDDDEVYGVFSIQAGPGDCRIFRR
jgi:hypothetical protein